MVEAISSTSNPTIKALRRLSSHKGRAASGLAIAEGPHLVEALREAGIVVRQLLTTDAADIDRHGDAESVVMVSQNVLASVSDTRHPQGPLAVFAIPDAEGIRHHDTVILHGISDPGNLGTLIRSATAFGFDVAVSGATADPWNPKVLRASAGAVFANQPRTSASPIADAEQRGLVCVAMVPRGGTELSVADDPIALLVGSEAHGLPDAMVEACQARLTIGMGSAVESLNAAVAGSIAMHAYAEQRDSTTGGSL
jgi:TrmH family RNA methyltransferase